MKLVGTDGEPAQAVDKSREKTKGLEVCTTGTTTSLEGQPSFYLIVCFEWQLSKFLIARYRR
jgi:hypothetical protein